MRILLFLMLCLSFFRGEAQFLSYSSTSRVSPFQASPTSDTTVHDISLTWVTSPFQHVARHDTTNTVTIQVPFGYFYPSWQIISMNKAHDVILTGSGVTVTWPHPQFLGVDSVNVYALHVVCSRIGINSHGATFPLGDWVYPGFLEVKPGRFKESDANQVIDVSSGSLTNFNGNNTDHAATGWKVYVKGSRTGTAATMIVFGFISTNPLKPVVFQFNNVTLSCASTSQKAFSIGPCQGVILDGQMNEIDYGLKLIRTAGSVENFYWNSSDSGGNTSKWTIISGISVDNGSYSTGGTGFVVQVDNRTGSNDSNYRNERLTISHCNVLNANNEAYYITTVTEGASPQYARIGHVIFHHNKSNHCRNEGAQIGGQIHSQYFKNDFQDTGLGAQSGQMNIVVLRESCQDVAFFMNTGLGTQDILQTFPGIYGQGPIEIFANTFETTGGTGLQNYLSRLSQSSVAGLSEIQQTTFNNTWIAKTNNNEFYSLYNWAGATPTTIMKFYADANIFVSTVTTQAVSHNSFSTANTITNNKSVLTSNIAQLKFVDQANKNYKLSMLSSSAFGFSRNSIVNNAKIHWLNDYDLYGYKYVASNIAAGSDSGFRLMTY